MALFDRSYNFLLVGHFKYSCMFCRFQVIWRWIIVTLKRSLRSFTLIPFESLGAVSYLPSIVTMAVCLTVYEISASKYRVTLKNWNWVRDCSRSLKMAPFNRSYTTFYWSAIISMLYIFELLSNFNSSASDRSNSYKIIQYNRNYIQYKMEK